MIVSRFAALPMLFAAAVVFPLFLLRKGWNSRAVFQVIRLRGARGEILTLREYQTHSRLLRNLPLGWALLTGKMRLFGVSRRPSGMSCPPEIDAEKPGLLTTEFIRRSVRVAYAGRDETDLEYLAARSFRTHAGIFLRTFPALFFAMGKNVPGKGRNALFEVEYDNLTMSEAVGTLEKRLRNGERTRIFFMNPDCFNKVWSRPDYRAALQCSEYVFPDGIGLVIAGKLLGRPLQENCNGTDLFPFLCEMAQRNRFSLYFLGGAGSVAQLTADSVLRQYPDCVIRGVRNGFFASEEEEQRAVREIAEAKPDILLVAMGVPRQELFITRHWEELHCGSALGVGGLFDFCSGRIPRAPKWMRDSGLEWVFRLMQEPSRMFRRYIIGNPVFLLRVIFYRGGLSAYRRRQAFPQENAER